MTYLPYLVRTAPGSTPQIASGFPLSGADPSLCTVWLRLSRRARDSYAGYWSVLQETQSFYDRPVPAASDLDLAVDAFREQIVDDVAAVAATVTLGNDGTIFVSGRPLDTTQRSGAALVQLEPRDDLLSPRSDWQRRALATNSRASVDAFRRSLGERGAQDAIVLREDGSASPLLGAVIVRIGDAFRGASPTTVVPGLFETLIESAAMTPRGGVIAESGLSRSDLDDAENGWWISPEFDVWDAVEFAGRTLPGTRNLSDFFVLS